MKGYWLVLGSDVSDPDAQAEYIKHWGPVAEKYKAKICPAQTPPILQEARDSSRFLVIEFPSFEDAQACYADPDYQEAMAFAHKAANRDLIILAGNITLS